MRLGRLVVGLVAGLLLGASHAGASGVTMTAQGSTTSLSASDNVIVDVFLDSDGPISIVSVAVVASSSGVLVYDGAGSAALPTNPAVPQRGRLLRRNPPVGVHEFQPDPAR